MAEKIMEEEEESETTDSRPDNEEKQRLDQVRRAMEEEEGETTDMGPAPLYIEVTDTMSSLLNTEEEKESIHFASTSMSQEANLRISEVTIPKRSDIDMASQIMEENGDDSPIEEEAAAEFYHMFMKRHSAPVEDEIVMEFSDSEEILWPEDFDEEEIDRDEFIPQYYTGTMDYAPDKSELVEKYKKYHEEARMLTQANNLLQQKIIEAFRKKKSLQEKESIPTEQSVLESRYSKYLLVWAKLKSSFTKDEEVLTCTITELKQFCHEEAAKIEIDYESYMRSLVEHARNAVHSQTGQKLGYQEVTALLHKQRQKADELKLTRLVNLALKSKMRQREAAIRSKEDVSGGHQMYDFEQLKIENQAYNEKIEERNEELMKFRRKIMSTIHITAHMKEKVYYLVNENEYLRRMLYGLEVSLSRKREALSKIKQGKDKLRDERNKLNQRSGLLGKRVMLHDFKMKQDQVDELTDKIALLKHNHAKYMSKLRSLKSSQQEYLEGFTCYEFFIQADESDTFLL